LKKAERNLSGNVWENTSKSKLGVFGFRFFAMSLKKNRLNMPRQMFEKAEKRLKKIKEETFSIKRSMPASPIWPTIQTLNTNLELLNIFA
jgi:hypothetical protein